ncbi:discoidin domain-containing protein [Mycoplasma leonicaptivi]|uniref:discoidin domain-containing protein n=1 Tax=Mycoplasma leonicaptivi TaxID=36742 RepID=UPI000AC3A5DE|nr:discoidin domain-containing protein [Mycoplasma leonicaptivi]
MKKRNKWLIVVSNLSAATVPLVVAASCGTSKKPQAPTNKGILQAKISEVNSYITSELNDAIYNNIKDKLIQDKMQAQAVVDKTDATQSEVEQALRMLEDNFNKAKNSKQTLDSNGQSVDKTQLISSISTVSSYIDTQLTDSKYQSVKDELMQSKMSAQAVVDKTDASANEVSSAKVALEKALEKAKLDKLKVNLKELIKKAEALDQTGLSQELKTKLTSKLSEAKAFATSTTSTKVDIDASTSSLTAVIKEVELEILKNNSIEEVKVELQKSIDAAKELIDSMTESKYSEVKKELEAAKMQAETAKAETNTTKEKLAQEKQRLDDAIDKAKQDKENLRETPSNVMTETKSFEETQYVYAFKDTPVKEALKSQIEQGWIFENLEEEVVQDDQADASGSDDSSDASTSTTGGSSTNTDASQTGAQAQPTANSGAGSSQGGSDVTTGSASSEAGEEKPTSTITTSTQPSVPTKIDRLVKPGFETFKGKKLKEGSQTVYDYLNVVIKGITKTVTYETSDLNTLGGTSNLEVVVDQSFNFNPTHAPLSMVVDGNKGQASRWDSWNFYGKEQDRSYITIKLKSDDAVVNQFKLWTRARGYSRGLQNNKALPTQFIKLYYSEDGTKFERVKNQDKETKEQLFILNSNGEIDRAANDNVDYAEINFDPVKAKYIRFEFKVPEIDGIKGQNLPDTTTNEKATTNFGIVGFNEVELVQLTDSGKQKWAEANNIERYKDSSSIVFPNDLSIEFDKTIKLDNTSILNADQEANKIKNYNLTSNFDLTTLTADKINVKKYLNETASENVDANIAVVVDEIATKTLSNKVIAKEFKISLFKDHEHKKEYILNVMNPSLYLRDFKPFTDEINEQYNSLMHEKLNDQRYNEVKTLKTQLDRLITTKLAQGVDHDYLTDKDEITNKFNEIRQKVAEIDGKTLLILKSHSVKRITNSKFEISVTLDKRFVKSGETQEIKLKTDDTTLSESLLTVNSSEWNRSETGTPNTSQGSNTQTSPQAQPQPAPSTSSGAQQEEGETVAPQPTPSVTTKGKDVTIKFVIDKDEDKTINVLGLTLGNEEVAKFNYAMELHKLSNLVQNFDRTWDIHTGKYTYTFDIKGYNIVDKASDPIVFKTSDGNIKGTDLSVTHKENGVNTYEFKLEGKETEPNNNGEATKNWWMNQITINGHVLKTQENTNVQENVTRYHARKIEWKVYDAYIQRLGTWNDNSNNKRFTLHFKLENPEGLIQPKNKLINKFKYWYTITTGPEYTGRVLYGNNEDYRINNQSEVINFRSPNTFALRSSEKMSKVLSITIDDITIPKEKIKTKDSYDLDGTKTSETELN